MKSQICLVLLTVISDFTIAKPTDNEERIMLRKRMDSDSVASSYVYRSDNGRAPQVYYLTADDLNRKFHFKPTSSPLVYYKSTPLVTYAPNYYGNYYQPKMRSRLVAFKPSPVDTSKSTSASGSGSSESDESGRNESNEKHSDESEDHSAEGGKSHEEKYHKKQGKKSNKGYKKHMEFSKGNKGSYEKNYKDNDHDEEGEHDAKRYDEADSYHEHEKEGHHKKSGDYGSKKHHKKGSKSKGYHNVFMKDEYKKDHTFYDTANHEGHFSKYGEDHKKHQNIENEGKKGTHYDAGFKIGHHKDKDGIHKGHYDEHDEGYKKKSGNAEKYGHQEQYLNNGGKDHHSHHAHGH